MNKKPMRILSAFLGLVSCFVVLTNASGCSLVSKDIQEVETTSLTTGTWSLARVPDVSGKGSTLSTDSYTEGAEWIPATVPGTVLTSFYNAGKIDDPYYGNNMEKLDENYFNVDYWYRTDFTVPASYKNRRVLLNFEGINWKADVFVNGKSVGEIEGAFIRGQFDVTDYVTVGGNNTMAVYIHFCDSNDNSVMPSFLCSASWDWMPAIPGRNMGIYKDVYLSASGAVRVDDPYIITELNDSYDEATIKISTDLTNLTDKKVSGTVKGTIRTKNGSDDKIYKFSKKASVSAGETVNVVVDSFDMKDPDLWWPNGMGDQNLYLMNIYFEASGVSDSEDVTFGVREYSYDYEETSGDNTPEDDVTIYVNGERVFCRGGNWGIPESMLNWTTQDFYDAVHLSAEEGFTMIRCWHGTSDFPAFYDACDEYGVMVWDEFWLNGSTGVNEKSMFMANVEDKIKRLRNHAALAVWCGENEATPPDGLNVKIQVLLTETKKTLDATRIYIPASNSGAVTGGITYQVKDLEWYFTNGRNVGFTTEYGCVNVWNIESMKNFLPESDLTFSAISNDTWDLHEYDDDAFGNKNTGNYTNEIFKRYGQANSATCQDMSDFCRNAQLLNYETFKAMFESWNVNMFAEEGGTSGALLWMSQQGWPGLVWSTYDYYMEENGAFFGCRSANEAIHVQYNYSTGLVQVINNTVSAYDGASVTAEIYNMDGSLVANKTETVNVAKTATADSFNVLDLAKSANLSKVYFIRLKLTDKDGNLLSENNYWRGKNNQDYTDLKNLGTAELSFEKSIETGDTSSTITLKITNTSSAVAFANRVKLNRDNAGEGEDARVLPTYYSDNYFTLMPGESKTITMTYDNVNLCGGNPQISVDAFNTSEYIF